MRTSARPSTRTLIRSLVPIGVMAMGAPTMAQLPPDWVTTHASGGQFTPRSLAVDAAGNSYVASTVTTGGDDDIALAKFGPDGALLWASVFNGPQEQDLAVAAAVTPDGSAAMAVGRSSAPGGSDYVVIRYDAETGEELWQTFYDGPAGGIDDPRAAAATPDGGVVVTGEVWNGDERSDYGTIKLDASGQLVWEATFGDNGPFLINDDRGEIIAVTPGGDVIVSGTARPASGGDDVVTFRYDGATGDQEWMARYSTSANERVNDVALAPDGDVVIYGTDPFGIDRQWLVVRYDGQSGVEQWFTLHNPGSDESPGGVAIDAGGDVYATGGTDPDGNDDNFNENLVVLALAGGDGSILWTDEFGAEGFNEADFGNDALIDSQGRLVVVGSSRSPSVVESPLNADAIIRRYDAATGELLDMGQVDSTEDAGPIRSDIFREVTADASGNLYVRGLSCGDVGVESRLLLASYADEDGGLPGDVNDDGVVNVEDLVALLLVWGDCPGCPEDVNDDGEVSVEDLVTVIKSWS